MKVYIAGKITGDPDYRAKFKRAEDVLREEGHTVINPAVLPSGLDRADYGRICAAMLDSADAVAFLDDYMDSPGATLEHEYSEYTDKKTMCIGDKYRAFEDQRIAPADAIRGSTREQVEKSWAGCEYCEKHKIDLVRIEMNYNDSPGSPERLNPTRVPKFCPMCGRPLTDEAVDIAMKRLEELYETE